MPHLNKEGEFRAVIRNYGLQTAKSGDSKSVAVTMRFEIFAEWDPETKTWVDRQHGELVFGSVWIIKKDGTVNTPAHEKLIQSSGWDGSFDSVIDESWKPWPVRITVEENYYEGNRSYRVSWVNHAESVPGGGIQKVDESTANSLKAQYSPKLRASAAAIQAQNETKHDVLNPEPTNPPPQAQAPDEVPF